LSVHCPTQLTKNIGDPITEAVEAGNCLKSYAPLLGSAIEIKAAVGRVATFSTREAQRIITLK
jgi:hypothetical protein